MKRRTNKGFRLYGETKTTMSIPGRGRMTFASKKEALRALDLAAMEQGGVISDLKFQPAFSIEIKGSKVCTYIADFQYVHDGKVIVEDVKGFKTKEYILKSKLMKAVLGITVKET